MLGGLVGLPHPAARADVDYVAGIGVGGAGGGQGGHGMVVFHCFTGWQSTSVARTVFHYR
jgi:hypothetical protein